jgi:hypothetical protein
VKLGIWKPPEPEPVAVKTDTDPSFHEFASGVRVCEDSSTERSWPPVRTGRQYRGSNANFVLAPDGAGRPGRRGAGFRFGWVKRGPRPDVRRRPKLVPSERRECFLEDDRIQAKRGALGALAT